MEAKKIDNLNDKIDPAENPSTGLLIDLDDGWNSNRVSNVTAPESNSNPPEWFDHVYEVITSKSPLETTDAANAEEWALFRQGIHLQSLLTKMVALVRRLLAE